MRLSKAHTKRLRAMLAERDRREHGLQERLGDRIAGSERSTRWREAEALRAVLAILDPQPIAPSSFEGDIAPGSYRVDDDTTAGRAAGGRVEGGETA